MADPTLSALTADFLDQVAEFFDNETPLSPDSLFTDPRDGEAITARGLLELIRLGKTDKPVRSSQFAHSHPGGTTGTPERDG